MNKHKMPLYKAMLIFISQLLRAFNQNKKLYVSLFISAILVILSTYINMSEYTFFSQLSLDEFKVDMAPTKDVIATENVTYIDEEKTEQKQNAKRRSMGAMFDRNVEEEAKLKKNYEEFVATLRSIKDSVNNVEQFIENVGKITKQQAGASRSPVEIAPEALSTLYKSSDSYDILIKSEELFNDILETGLVNLQDAILKEYGSKDATITYIGKDKTEVLDFSSFIFMHKKDSYANADLSEYIEKKLEGSPYDYSPTIYELIRPFIKENVVFNEEDTEKRIKKEIEKLEPVVLSIVKGEKLIEKNVVIKEDAYNRLKQYIEHKKGNVFLSATLFFAFIVYILSLYALAFFLFSKDAFGDVIERKYFLLLLLVATLTYLEVLFLRRFSFLSTTLAMIPLLPCLLFSMLFYILKSKKMAISVAIILTLSILGASNFNVPLSLYSLASSFAGIALVKNTGRRIDLIKTAAILALIQPMIVITCMSLFPSASGGTFFLIIGSSLNSFFSGVLLLGFLPLIEVILNCPTTFRLIEISDLNSPLMKQMLVTVSGTYSHSMMVATLAENACRAIGANALLARVGSYYHDIGKMEMAEYFIENQHDGINKHDSIPPRLSATVLRSHVQRSVEKARNLGLPEAVIDIVSEHHGNGLIAYFYSKAKEKGEYVDPIDFSYPGRKPKTKESAVVMLADITEAGARSISKHSVPSITKFVNSIFKAKIDSGQLDDSPLTFSDITVIKNTFIDILSGYYHSRIKYPNQKDDDEEDGQKNEK